MNVNSRIARANFTGFTSGAIASFTGLRQALIKVKVNASGVSECNVVRCGANLWDEEWENGTFNTTTGANINTSSANQQIRAKNLIPVTPSSTYYFVFPLNTAGQGLWVIFYDSSKNVIPYSDLPSGYTHDGNSLLTQLTTRTITMPSNCSYIRFYVTNAYGATYNHDIAINYPSTDTAYHAHTIDTYTIPVGQMDTQINQIIGTNNIFVHDENVDTGNVEVYYVTI